MEWVLWLNTHDSFTYRYTHGDKDTFGAAFYVTDKAEQYYQVSWGVSAKTGFSAQARHVDLSKQRSGV